ncbi:MAG: hypothetical protein HC859_16980 [Bacteroidia bacterium]|nr:hypothetical protein [Bacteroidia bacterium]
MLFAIVIMTGLSVAFSMPIERITLDDAAGSFASVFASMKELFPVA